MKLETFILLLCLLALCCSPVSAQLDFFCSLNDFGMPGIYGYPFYGDLRFYYLPDFLLFDYAITDQYSCCSYDLPTPFYPNLDLFIPDPFWPYGYPDAPQYPAQQQQTQQAPAKQQGAQGAQGAQYRPGNYGGIPFNSYPSPPMY